MNNDVVMLFSAGRDSVLSTCYLVESGYNVRLVTFENGQGIASNFAAHTAGRLIKRYGKTRISFIGVRSTAAFWREFFLPYFNMKPSEVSAEYGELNVSQFHCLTCRSAMYIWSIIYALENGIDKIADGARINQAFVIELPIFIEKVKNLFREFGINLLLPVWDLESDSKRKNELLARGIIPKTLEPQCLLGVPLPLGKAPDLDIQKAVIVYYEKIVLPKARELIKEGIKKKIELGGKLC